MAPHVEKGDRLQDVAVIGKFLKYVMYVEQNMIIGTVAVVLMLIIGITLKVPDQTATIILFAIFVLMFVYSTWNFVIIFTRAGLDQPISLNLVVGAMSTTILFAFLFGHLYAETIAGKDCVFTVNNITTNYELLRSSQEFILVASGNQTLAISTSDIQLIACPRSLNTELLDVAVNDTP
jgi:hypothetical protein